MELELKKTSLDTCESGGELILTQEETLETIVPDYCPDMARIITTEGKVCIHSRELRDGRGEVTGTVRVTVLYTPEGERGVRALQFALPFTVETESRALPDCHTLTAETDTEFLESRMLNPRKILTHCKLVTRLTGYQRTQLNFCTDVETQESVEKRQERQRAILLTQIAEKDFTFTDQMNLPAGRSGAAEVLSNRITPTVTEIKTVGSKLIFKGVFVLSVLYRTAEGNCCSCSGELPFSQIMETESSTEGTAPTLQLQLTGADLQVSGDDPEGRQLAVTLYLHATALLRREEELTLLSDLYSTCCEARYEAAPLTLTAFHQTLSRRQTVRDVLEIGVAAESILSLSVSCGAVSVSRERESAVLRTSAVVRALYLDEGGVPLMAERSMDVTCPMELPEDCRITARALCTDEVQGTPGDRGIEVRFTVDFRIEADSRVKRPCITAARLEPESTEDGVRAPSLVLRCLGPQESAWDLAKRHHTTIAAILSANGLESESALPRDTLLLIPRKRR